MTWGERERGREGRQVRDSMVCKCGVWSSHLPHLYLPEVVCVFIIICRNWTRTVRNADCWWGLKQAVCCHLKELFTQKLKFSHYLLTLMLTEGQFTRRKFSHQMKHFCCGSAFLSHDNCVLALRKQQTFETRFQSEIFWNRNLLSGCVNWQAECLWPRWWG